MFFKFVKPVAKMVNLNHLRYLAVAHLQAVVVLAQELVSESAADLRRWSNRSTVQS